ncbi:MAG: TPM domain-containing protein, partial [Candidatus Vecturithrix sp.]|nr:TPM domain-containing protein [Candidatus Vecturithrix sp.]
MRKGHWVIILLIVVYSGSVFAIEYPQLNARVNDYVGVLNADQQQDLENLLKEFNERTPNQIFVAIQSRIPEDATLEGYVNELFERWQPGDKEQDTGVLLAIFIDDRKLRIEVGYGHEATLTDAVSKLIINNDIAPDFKQNNYYSGIRQGVESIIRNIAPDYNIPAASTQPGSVQKPSSQERSTTSQTSVPQLPCVHDFLLWGIWIVGGILT